MNNILLETIKIENGTTENIYYHQKRFDETRVKLFGSKTKIDLIKEIDPPKDGLYRCRVIYDTTIRSVEFLPYQPKIFKTFKIVASGIDYSFKYANRHELDDLKAQYPQFDEIIIEKNGYLKDTTISNIAFFDGKDWLTPTSPLLRGTMRAKLIDKGFLKTADISADEIKKFKRFALINAMMGFKEIEEFHIEN